MRRMKGAIRLFKSKLFIVVNVALASAADLSIEDKWFDHNEKTRVSKAGKLMRKILERHFSVDTPEGRILVQLILGGVKHSYRLKEKSGE